MTLLGFIVFVAVLGLIWWAVTTYIPMPPAGKMVLTIVFVVVLVVALLQVLGPLLGLGLDLRLHK